jgi:prepilin-type N-terminal cleavage/methylation domain-containing protein
MTTSSRNPGEGAFTLLEMVLAVSISGIVLTAVLLFLTSSSRTADRVMDMEAAEDGAVQAALRLDEYIATAGLCRMAVSVDASPMLEARQGRLVFTTDTEDPGSPGPEDTLTIESTLLGVIVTDGRSDTLFSSQPGVEASFSFLDWTGEPIDQADLGSRGGLDRIRTVRWTLTSTCGQGTFELSGSCTPPNLMIR